jgi:hypothetical protein
MHGRARRLGDEPRRPKDDFDPGPDIEPDRRVEPERIERGAEKGARDGEELDDRQGQRIADFMLVVDMISLFASVSRLCRVQPKSDFSAAANSAASSPRGNR